MPVFVCNAVLADELWDPFSIDGENRDCESIEEKLKNMQKVMV